MSLEWKQERANFFLYKTLPNGSRKIVGRVSEDRETDTGAAGWQVWAQRAPVITPHGYTMRRLERAGYFRRLRDAMQYVMVLHKLEE